MFWKIQFALSLAACVLFAATVTAGRPDFSLCDGARGAAFGLCRAGIAIGCDADSSQPGCASIEEQYESITGGPAPWTCELLDPEDPYYNRFEYGHLGPFDDSCETDADCVISGCSGEVCASELTFTTCEVLPYQPDAGCGCIAGACQWNSCSL